MELVVARGSTDWRTGMGRSATVKLTESAASASAAARHDQEFVWLTSRVPYKRFHRSRTDKAFPLIAQCWEAFRPHPNIAA